MTQIREILLQSGVSEGLAKPAGSKQFAVSGKTGTAQISQGAAGYKYGQDELFSQLSADTSLRKRRNTVASSPFRSRGFRLPVGLMAGSVFGKIAERVYAKNLRFDIRSAIDSTTNVIPTVKSGNLNEALYALNSLNIPTQHQLNKEKGKELWGHVQATPSVIILQNQGKDSSTVPSVIGMGAKDAVYLLESKGLKVRLNGVGRVKSQSIAGGSRIIKGQTILLTMHN